MTSREIARGGAERIGIVCDGWPVELVAYGETWSIVRDGEGAYRALTRTLRIARGTAFAGSPAVPDSATAFAVGGHRVRGEAEGR